LQAKTRLCETRSWGFSRKGVTKLGLRNERKDISMQYQIIVNIPDHFDEYIRSIENFEQFVSNAAVEALKRDNDTEGRKKRLSDAAELMLTEYKQDKELTCFTSLDGEPVYE